jgi:hypothetical protein
LCEQVLPRERNPERLKSAVYDRCRELHLAPPTPERIDRVVRSAARTYEESFCAEILARLSPDNQASLDALLQPAPDEEDSQREAKSEMPRALWHTLRSEPGRSSLDTIHMIRKGQACGSVVYCSTSFSICSRRRTKMPIIYPDLRLDYKVATHPISCARLMQAPPSAPPKPNGGDGSPAMPGKLTPILSATPPVQSAFLRFFLA